MTTTVQITNLGPGDVRVRLRNIAKSARKNDSDVSETILPPGGYMIASKMEAAVYEGRKLIIEEVE